MNGKIVFNLGKQMILHWDDVPDGSVVQSVDEPQMVLLKVSEYGLRLRKVGAIEAGTIQYPGPHSTWVICNYKLDIDLVY